ncbi:MAG: peptidylprolyl isomerase [Waddliaceae bacterium]|nr:peptidylprolyl isomerase [Waddliaceae bacterium]
MARKPVVVFETTLGQVEVALMSNVAPQACENLISHAEAGYYNGVIFHRVIKGFMIQGGDPTGTGRGGESIWGHPFEDECTSDVQFTRPGLLAMANAGPNTNGSQFFITTASTPWLNGRHTIFGEVTEGYDIVEKMESVATDSYDKPLEDIKIIRCYVREANMAK